MRSASFANSNRNVKAFKLMEFDNINNCRAEHDFSIKLKKKKFFAKATFPEIIFFSEDNL